MPNWLRWTLVLPVAVIAYFAIQVVVGIGSERLPLSDYLQDSASQLINSILGPWAFVYPSSKIAPVGKSFQTAVFLTTLFFIITIVMVYILLRAGYTVPTRPSGLTLSKPRPRAVLSPFKIDSFSPVANW